jgi:hypothetical protein
MKENTQSSALPIYVRYADLKRSGVIKDYSTLLDYIERRDFPAGFKLSRKVRVWDAAEVARWIEHQRAALPNPGRKRSRLEQPEAA